MENKIKCTGIGICFLSIMLIVDNANGARERALKSARKKTIILARLCLSPKSAGRSLIEGFNQDKAFVTPSPSAVALLIKLNVFFFNTQAGVAHASALPGRDPGTSLSRLVNRWGLISRRGICCKLQCSRRTRVELTQTHSEPHEGKIRFCLRANVFVF